MKIEHRTLVFSSIVNFIVAIIKIISGNIFGLASLIADGFYTVSDFITDILALIGAKVGKKRPNKRYPLGYGNFEFVMQMIMGFVILLVGIVVIYMSFNMHFKSPNLLVIIPIVLVIMLKIYSSTLLLKVGKNIKSGILVTSSKESFIDALSSSVLLVIIFLNKIFDKADMIGSILIGILIIYQAFKIIVQNGILLIGENSYDEKIDLTIKNIMNKYKKIKLVNYNLIKHGSYYQIILNVSISKDYTVRSLLKAEMNIKSQILSKKLGIKFIDFDLAK